jgi:hypothetical protein
MAIMAAQLDNLAEFAGPGIGCSVHSERCDVRYFELKFRNLYSKNEREVIDRDAHFPSCMRLHLHRLNDSATNEIYKYKISAKLLKCNF